MSLAFDSIRFKDGESYPINAEIVRLYDLPSGEQVDAGALIETRGQRSPQTLKRSGIGALGRAIFSVTSGGGGKPAPEKQPLQDAKNSSWIRTWRCCFAFIPVELFGNTYAYKVVVRFARC
jgi:hypothetical protein